MRLPDTRDDERFFYLTPKELAAIRIHDVDVNCEWTNIGGS